MAQSIKHYRRNCFDVALQAFITAWRHDRDSVAAVFVLVVLWWGGERRDLVQFGEVGARGRRCPTKQMFRTLMGETRAYGMA